MESNLLLWAIPLFPLLGFLINAFLGAGLTKSPRPVVETGPDAGHAAPTTTAPVHNAGPSDAPEFAPNAGVTAAGGAATYEMPDQDDLPPVPAKTAASHDDHGHGAHGGGHGHGHDDVHLSPGGTKIVGFIATAMIGLSFLVALALFFQVRGGSAEGVTRLFSPAWTWMSVPAVGARSGLEVGFRLMLDPLTSLMTLIITGIGFLIHLYSTG